MRKFTSESNTPAACWNHPQETKENKAILKRLIEKWARPVFNKYTDHRNDTTEIERVSGYKSALRLATNELHLFCFHTLLRSVTGTNTGHPEEPGVSASAAT